MIEVDKSIFNPFEMVEKLRDDATGAFYFTVERIPLLDAVRIHQVAIRSGVEEAQKAIRQFAKDCPDACKGALAALDSKEVQAQVKKEILLLGREKEIVERPEPEMNIPFFGNKSKNDSDAYFQGLRNCVNFE